jgi:hypothetical protein
VKTYRLLAIAAANLRTDEKTMLEFNRAGWIEVISKDGRAFVSGQDEYRARFILHLRAKMKLTDGQIGTVLANESPPYSLDQVPAILAHHASES